jgi:hypothetical protein
MNLPGSVTLICYQCEEGPFMILYSKSMRLCHWGNIWIVAGLLAVFSVQADTEPMITENLPGSSVSSIDNPAGVRVSYQQIFQAIRVKKFTISKIQMPREELPDYFTTAVEHEGSSHILRLYKRSVRSASFQVLAQVEGGRLVEISPDPVRTYEGYVEGEPETLVSASLLPTGLRACVFPRYQIGWSVEPMRTVYPAAARNEHIVYNHSDIEPTELSNDALQVPQIEGEPPVAYYSAQQIPSASAIATAAGDVRAASYAPYECDVMRAEIGFDADYAYYHYCGDNVNKVLSNLEDVLVSLNVVYVRDCLIEYQLGRVVIRTDLSSCPYYNSTSLLNEIRNQWNNGQYGTTHDVAVLVTGRTNMGYGGQAWQGAVCGSYRYSVCGGGWGIGRLRNFAQHELGHNWGCADGHANCPEGSTIMCGHLISRFSGEEVKTIIAHRDSRQCLDNIGPYQVPMTPYAAMDRIYTQINTPIRVDVLANDHDANCDVIVIDGFDMVSELGGTIACSAGTGPDGRDELLYTPASDVRGEDTFTYTITDATGRQATGTVRVMVKVPNILQGYWKLDEASGTVAHDSSGNGYDGTLNGTFTFDTALAAGKFRGALSFNGSDDYIETGKTAWQLGELNGNAPRTITAWVFTRGFNDGGIYEMGQQTPGQDFSLRTKPVDNQWRVQNWGSDPATGDIDFDYDSKDKWVHFAHVYDGNVIRIYANGNLVVNEPRTLNTADTKTFKIGRWHDSCFNGAIDDVRIYKYALNVHEIGAIMSGGPAENPSPFDSEVNSPQRGILSWLPGATADYHNVYLGISYDGVAIATTASSEYKGRQSEAFYVPFLNTNSRYFWRIDEVTTGAIVIPGKVWSFVTGQNGGTITREVWTGITGAAVADLVNSRRYSDWPNISEEITSFEGPVDWAENYGTRIHGFLIPPETGSYTFWIASNDAGELWLSSDANPANQERVAKILTWTGPREWDKFPEQKSGAITLIAGKAYYIKALQKQGPLNDNIAVAWEGPSIHRQVISGLYLSPFDTDIPTPNPMSWASAPHPTGRGSISMTATAALDRSGVEYYFACTSGSGHDSGWQNSPVFEDTGLDPNTIYTYSVIVRDKSYNLNITGPSQPWSARTFLGGDFEPDGDVDFVDYAIFALQWSSTATFVQQNSGKGDLDGDNDVDFEDLAILTENWLEGMSQ